MTDHPLDRRTMRGRRRWRGRADEGSVPVELAYMALPILALFMATIVTGRITDADADVQAAASAAARAAAQHATPAVATDAARQAAAANLAASTPCEDIRVETDTGRLEPGGAVTVTVSCSVDFSQFALVAVPGQRHFRATSSEVVDTYLGVGP